MNPLGWNVDPQDWDIEEVPRRPGHDRPHRAAVLRKRTRAGSIVLSHDGGGLPRLHRSSAYKALLPDLTQQVHADRDARLGRRYTRLANGSGVTYALLSLRRGRMGAKPRRCRVCDDCGAALIV